MQNLTNKKWIIIFLSIIVVCSTAIAVFHILPGGRVAVITKDEKILYKIDLSSVKESYALTVGGNVILVENGYISMQSADCPDKLCVKQGKISEVGSIVCLPNKVIIRIDRNEEIDAALR